MSSAQETLFIGLSLLNHDSGLAAIDVANQRVFAMSTERLTRFKHDSLPPFALVDLLLEDWGIDGTKVARVVVSTALRCQLETRHSRTLFERELAFREALGGEYVREHETAVTQFKLLSKEAQRDLLHKNAAGRRYLALGESVTEDVSFCEMVEEGLRGHLPHARFEFRSFDHHRSHAASTLALCGFDDPVFLTLDGWGDGHFSKAFVRQGRGLREISASVAVEAWRDSRHAQLSRDIERRALATGIFDQFTLGHFYSIVTWLLGFEPVSDEGKVEALAAYGEPENEFLEALRSTIRVDADTPRLVIDPEVAAALFLDAGRLRGYVDRVGREGIAAAMQHFLESNAVDLLRAVLARHPRTSVALSGGCAANVIMNMRIFEEVCPSVFVTPAMADDGTAFGACVLSLLGEGVQERELEFIKRQTVPCFGTISTPGDFEEAIAEASAQLEAAEVQMDWPVEVARRVHAGEIGALYQGRMEWGPRALGHRSIIANPCLASTRKRINSVVKKRPLFQPFCPVMLEEEKDRLFAHAYMNRHMTCAFRMKPEFREFLPSAIHVDGTARVQFLAEADNPGLHRVLVEFKRLTGFGVLVNTSFNLHGRTIVATPRAAIRDFLDSGMDFLVLEGRLFQRKRSQD